MSAWPRVCGYGQLGRSANDFAPHLSANCTAIAPTVSRTRANDCMRGGGHVVEVQFAPLRLHSPASCLHSALQSSCSPHRSATFGKWQILGTSGRKWTEGFQPRDHEKRSKRLLSGKLRFEPCLGYPPSPSYTPRASQRQTFPIHPIRGRNDCGVWFSDTLADGRAVCPPTTRHRWHQARSGRRFRSPNGVFIGTRSDHPPIARPSCHNRPVSEPVIDCHGGGEIGIQVGPSTYRQNLRWDNCRRMPNECLPTAVHLPWHSRDLAVRGASATDFFRARVSAAYPPSR